MQKQFAQSLDGKGKSANLYSIIIKTKLLELQFCVNGAWWIILGTWGKFSKIFGSWLQTSPLGKVNAETCQSRKIIENWSKKCLAFHFQQNSQIHTETKPQFLSIIWITFVIRKSRFSIFFFKIKGENSIIWFLARKVKYLKKWWKLHNVIFGAKIQMFKRFWWLLLKSNLIFWREKSTFMHFWYFVFSGKIQISFLTIFQFLTKIELLSQCVR